MRIRKIKLSAVHQSAISRVIVDDTTGLVVGVTRPASSSVPMPSPKPVPATA